MLLKTISNYYWVISNTLKIILEEISIKRNKIGHTSQPTTLAETSSSLRGQAGSWTPGNTAPPRSLSSLSKSPTAPPLLFTIPLVEAYRPIRSQVSVLNQVNYPTQLPPAPPSIIPSAYSSPCHLILTYTSAWSFPHPRSQASIWTPGSPGQIKGHTSTQPETQPQTWAAIFWWTRGHPGHHKSSSQGGTRSSTQPQAMGSRGAERKQKVRKETPM